MKVGHSVYAAMSLVLLMGQLGPAAAQSRVNQHLAGAVDFSGADFGVATVAQGQGRMATVQPRPMAKSIASISRAVRLARPVAFTAATGSGWMHRDVAAAWALGYRGRGVNITMVDSFSTSYRLRGSMSGSSESLSHGGWTRKQASMMALDARMFEHDFSRGSSRVQLQSGFNVMNLSYGIYYRAGTGAVRWNLQEASLIGHAKKGAAVVVKAAGNDGVAIGAANSSGRIDLLGRDLIGAQSAIFVGALSAHGTTAQRASLASYSNMAGTSRAVQDQFLVVGVLSRQTGLMGTSFAAPIVSGYAAILKSKFTAATPTQIADQLLGTARQDTITGYSRVVHGQGEASLSRALAPTTLR